MAESESQVVGAADVGRVGDGHEQQIVAEEAHRHGLVACRQLAREKQRGLEVEVRLGQVDVLEPVLLGQGLREVLRAHPAVPDDDLPEPLAGQLLLLEGALDLLHGQEAAIDQQRAEVLPGEVGRFHLACIVICDREMKAVLQRVTRASVRVEDEVVGEIGRGLCVLLGVARSDGPEAAARLAGKVARLRVFEHDAGRFDRSLLDIGGEALVVSQFTLLGDTRRRGLGRTSRRPLRGIRPNRSTRRSARRCASKASTSRPASSERGWHSSSSTTGRSRSCSRSRAAEAPLGRYKGKGDMLA